MKRVLPILAVTFGAAVVFTSCGNKQADQVAQTVSIDTAGLAQYESWKKQQEFAAQYALYQANVEKTAKTTKSNSVKPVRKSTTGSMSTSTSYPAKETPTTQKKGWSKAAKGAAIGAASGAVIGAVIGKKNRALGAVIGGVAGGGIGYGIGRHMDKKDGR